MSDLSKELLSRADLIFGKIAEAAASAGTFAMEQLPDIALQFILYNRVLCTSIFVLNICIFILCIWATLKWFKVTEGIILVGTTVACALNMMAMAANFSPFLMVWFAPKIFLITELVKLVKG